MTAMTLSGRIVPLVPAFPTSGKQSSQIAFCFFFQFDIMTTNAFALKHLGPHETGDVDDDILGMLQFDGIPVIVKQVMADGVAAFAVLARNDVRIACIGCFKRDVLVSDTAPCKKCGSFVKHWDTKAGFRRLVCKPDGDVAKLEGAHAGRAVFAEASAAAKLDNETPDDMVTDKERLVKDPGKVATLEGFTDDELLGAVKARHPCEHIVMNMDDDAFAKAVDAKDFKSLIGARPFGLIRELRHQHVNSECKTHCGDKKDDMPQRSDAVGADVTVVKEPVVMHGTRSTKRQKQLKATVEIFLFSTQSC